MSLIIWSLLVYVMLFAVRAIYRLWFHPLARFPGPSLSTVSRLYEAYYDLIKGEGGQFSSQIRRLHEMYGPIIRINTEELSIQDPDFHEHIYASLPAIRDKTPATAYILGTTAGIFGELDHFHHRKRRAAGSLLFSSKNLVHADRVIRIHVEHLCTLLRLTRGQVWEMRVRFMSLKLDIFFDWAFAKLLRSQQDEKEAQHWDEAMQALAQCAPYIKLFPSFLPILVELPPSLVRLVSPGLARMLRIRYHIFKHTALAVEAQQPASEQPGKFPERSRPLIQTLLGSALPSHEKDAHHLSQIASEMFAASATTERVMTRCTFNLLNRSSTLALLQEELDKAIPNPKDIPPIKVLEGLTYLNAVIKESLRLAAPVCTRFPLVAREPLFYQGWKIPPGTPISVNSRDVMHDASIFPEPFTFQPERWLEPSTSGRLDHYFLPFNRGTRMCLGKEFAMVELQITIATLFRRFELELVDTIYERDVETKRDCFLSEPSKASRGVKIRVIGERN